MHLKCKTVSFLERIEQQTAMHCGVPEKKSGVWEKCSTAELPESVP